MQNSPELQQAVLDAIEDEEGVDYAKNTVSEVCLTSMVLYPKGQADFDFTGDIFKKIVKEFYTSGEGDNAYAK